MSSREKYDHFYFLYGRIIHLLYVLPVSDSVTLITRPRLTALETLYQSVTGQTMKKYYRPPQGKYSESNLQMAKELGYKTAIREDTVRIWQVPCWNAEHRQNSVIVYMIW